MMPGRNRLKWMAVALTLTCIASSSFAQKPKKYLSLATKEFKKGDYDAALGLYQTAFMLDSSMKQDKKFSEDVANYYEAQIRYGIAKATSAKNRGDLPEAWSWYVRVSRTSSSLPEVKSAGTEARRIHDQIAANYLAEAKRAEGDGRVIDAVIYANQARAYGLEEDARQILNRYGGNSVRIDGLASNIRTVNESMVTGDVLNGRILQAVATDRSLLPVLYGEGAMF